MGKMLALAQQLSNICMCARSSRNCSNMLTSSARAIDYPFSFDENLFIFKTSKVHCLVIIIPKMCKRSIMKLTILIPLVLLGHLSLSASDIDTKNMLKEKLRNAYAVIFQFTQERMNKFEDPIASDRRDACRSARRLTTRLLSTTPEINPALNDNATEKDLITKAIHLLYIALQEEENLSEQEFKKYYDISPNELIHPNPEKMSELEVFIANTKLSLTPDNVRKECEQLYEKIKSAQGKE